MIKKFYFISKMFRALCLVLLVASVSGLSLNKRSSDSERSPGLSQPENQALHMKNNDPERSNSITTDVPPEPMKKLIDSSSGPDSQPGITVPDPRCNQTKMNCPPKQLLIEIFASAAMNTEPVPLNESSGKSSLSHAPNDALTSNTTEVPDSGDDYRYLPSGVVENTVEIDLIKLGKQLKLPSDQHLLSIVETSQSANRKSHNGHIIIPPSHHNGSSKQVTSSYLVVTILGVCIFSQY